jgi:hypothetical protein
MMDQNGSTRTSQPQSVGDHQPVPEPKRVGYGLPCARCKAYYAADLNICPYCQCAERVTPATQEIMRPSSALKEEIAGPSELEHAEILPGSDEDEPLFAASARAGIGEIYTAPVVRCAMGQHADEAEPAAVCRSCYHDLQDRLERVEAALSIETREAAQIIYEAVWADPSPTDPTRTYQNAAQAILNEIRQRAGLALFVSNMKPYTH